MTNSDFCLQNGIKLTDPNFYADITKEKLADVLKSDSQYEIPLLEERVQVLQEAGRKLLKVRCQLYCH